MWDDNARPDKDENVDSYERITFQLEQMKQHRYASPDLGTILVHCRYSHLKNSNQLFFSAGCGRTGTLIALYALVEQVEYQMKMRNEKNGERHHEFVDTYYEDSNPINHERVSIFGTVRRIREQRWNLVKLCEQYKYIYAYMKLWLSKNYKK